MSVHQILLDYEESQKDRIFRIRHRADFYVSPAIYRSRDRYLPKILAQEIGNLIAVLVDENSEC